MTEKRDGFYRPLRDLRASVTDRFDLRSSYCMPSEMFGAGFTFMSQEQLLSWAGRLVEKRGH